MPANPATARNFRFTSDYPMDMIIYLKSGSISVAGFPDAGTTTFAHNLPATPLVDMVWSTTPTFDISYLSGSGPAPQDATRNTPYGIIAQVSADATNISIGYNNSTDPAVTIYYRIYGFEQSDGDDDYEFTASSGDPFVFNTDYNYTKVYDTGIGNTVITNLGYLPQTELFSEDNTGVISPPRTGDNALDYTGSTSPIGFMVTTTDVTYDSGGASRTMHSRVYLDEAGQS